MHRSSVANSTAWLLPFVTVAAVTIIGDLLKPYLGSIIPYTLFLLAITITALFSGFLPGILATFISVASIARVFVVPQYGFSFSHAHDLIATGIFIVVGTVISGLGYIVKRSKREVEASEERLIATFDNAALGIVETDTTGRFIAANNRISEMLSYSREEFLDMDVDGITAPEDLPLTKELNTKLRAGQVKLLNYEKRYLKRDGTPLWVHVTVSAMRDPKGHLIKTVGTAEDISERKKAEQALRESETRFSLLADSVPVLIWQCRPDKYCDYFNKGWLEFTGRSLEQELGSGWMEGVHPDDRQRCQEVFFSAIDKHQPFEMEYRLRNHLGEYRWILDIGRPRFSADKTFSGYIGGCIDIDERRKTTEALRESESRFRMALESSNTGWWHWDFQIDQLVGDARVKHLLGLPSDAPFSFQSLLAQTASEDRPVLEQRALALKQAAGDYEVEYRVIWPDGSLHWLFVKGRSFNGPDNRPLYGMGTAMDITDRKESEIQKAKMEAHIQRSQRLESIGTLAGGIAHDFNNLLAGLFGYLEVALICSKEGSHEKIAKYLQKSLDALGRAKGLTQQLLTFSKGGAPTAKLEDIGSVLKEAASFTLSGSNTYVDFNIPQSLWPCKIDQNQMRQAIDNILINAKQAMPEGGRVSIAAENIAEGASHPKTLSPGRYICFSISDQGPGIPPEAMEHIFDPFFTTKESGHGLGLAIAFSIVKRHGGALLAKSETGKGTTFSIYLPAVEPTDLSIVSESQKESKLSSHRGTVLVMDDEEILREVVGAMLRDLGYSVVFAEHGEEAIRLYREALNRSEPFKFVILDLTIKKGMGGKDTIKKLLEIDPEVRAVVSSGYSNDPAVSQFADYGFKAALSKPFQYKKLEETIGHVLTPTERAWLHAV